MRVIRRIGTILASLLVLGYLMPAGAQSTQKAAAASTRAAARAETAAPTWASRIAPIFYANCTTCHHPGGAGPFSLLTYHDALRWGAQVATVTQSRYMPPWLPEHQGGAFEDERRLTDGEIAAIARWVKASMPEGDASAAPAEPQYSATWQHGAPDLVLKVEHPFVLAASGTDVFRNFVLPYPLKQSHYIRAVEIRPGVPEIVHHANILIDRTASLRRAHPADWQAGIPGMEVEVDAGNTFDPDSHFLFWKPDSPVLVEPKGREWRLDPGDDLVLNMHLKPSGKAEAVSAEIGVYFSDTPPTEQPMLLQLEHDRALDIPAGARDFVVEDSLKLPIDVDLLGIYPHAHYLGKRMEAWATLPGGRKEPLITIADWDIDRQSVYRYKQPVRLPAGTVVQMRYVYDNSADNVHNPHSPPVRVVAGNRSEDEMAHLWLQVLPVTISGAKAEAKTDPRLVLEEAWMRSRLAKEPGDAIARYDLAAALAGENRYGEAAAEYRKLLGARPGDARALNSLGATLESAGDWEQARAAYAQVVSGAAGGGAAVGQTGGTAIGPTGDGASTGAAGRLDPDGVGAGASAPGAVPAPGAALAPAAAGAAPPAVCDARFNLARLDVRHGQEGEAEQEFRALLAACPEDAAMHSGLGVALSAEQRTSEAGAEFRRALTLDPHDSTALENFGAEALASGDAQTASGLLAEAVQQQPGDAETHQQLAAAYAELGRPADAIAELRVALALSPKEAGAHASLAQALAAAGQLQEAVGEQKAALTLDANDADGWNNLGVLEVRGGRPEAARDDFRRALSLAPGHAQARGNLERLGPS